jgi:hypothetical protein
MKIFWRVCEKQETLSFVPRWENRDKIEIIKKCWISLQNGINSDEDEIVVVEDGCSEDTLDYLEEKNKVKKLSFHHVKPGQGETHELLNGKSSHFVEVANLIDESTKIFQDEIHFMCNDDFLFLPLAITAMKDIFDNGWNGFVLPYDYPDRYTIDKTRLCEVYLGKYCHWRTVPSCTSITSARGRVWQQYMRSFKRAAFFNDDAWTWEAYNFAKSRAICPIPGLATHLTENCMTPFIDWKTVWDSIEI